MTGPPFDCRKVLAGIVSDSQAVPRSVIDRRLWLVLAHAAAVDLFATARHAGAFLRGKRVRGWNGLCALANRHPQWLECWRRRHRATLAGGLQGVVAERRLAPVRLAAVIANATSDPAAGSRTARNLWAVLGDALTTVAVEEVGIAALARYGWSWLLVLRPGDTIDPAFGDLARLIAADSSGVSAWFWDCDSALAAPTIKPDWDPVLDCSIDLLAGSLIVSRALFDSVYGDWRAGGDAAAFAGALGGAARATRPGHLPALLGCNATSTVRSGEGRSGAQPAPNGQALPVVTIIVLTRDRADLLIPLFGLLDRVDYPAEVERIVVDNGSVEPELIAFLDSQQAQGRLHWLQSPGPFNFAALNNMAAAVARGGLLCLLNNDVVPLDSEWLSRMAHRACDPAVGAVGALLTYPDGTIQHAGVALGLGGAAGHVQRGVDPAAPRWANWHAMSRRVEAVTAACLVVRKAAFDSVGGFDAARFPVAFNDVDLCLRLQQAGLQNVYEAGARLVHHESLSRGADSAPVNAGRFAAELAALRQRWNTETHHDPCWSPLFSRTSERCLLVP